MLNKFKRKNNDLRTTFQQILRFYFFETKEYNDHEKKGIDD